MRSPTIACNKLDLPEPISPIIVTNSPFLTVTLTSLSVINLPSDVSLLDSSSSSFFLSSSLTFLPFALPLSAPGAFFLLDVKPHEKDPST